MNDEIIKQLGLSRAQSAVYVELLKTGEMSPPEIAERVGEKRTNAYMALDKLESLGLVAKNTSGKKTTYKANNPTNLKKLLVKRQSEIKSAASDLNHVLPQLISTYKLSHSQPGVLHLAGIDGLKVLYEDILRENTDISIVASSYDRVDQEVSDYIDHQIELQQAAGVKSRVIVDKVDTELQGLEEDLAKKGVGLRVFESLPFSSQVITYGDTVAFSTFIDTPVTTIINSEEIAHTVQELFEGIWRVAKPLN